MTDEGASIEKLRVATPSELVAARESRRMSQVDISQRIKLQVKQVNALEEGQWDTLPGKSFVRGALRSYGKLLDVDVDPLLESIGGYAEPAPVQEMRPIDASLSRTAGNGYHGDRRGSPIPWVISGLIGVVALVLYFGADQDTSRVQSWLPSVTMAPSEPTAGTAPASPSSTSSGAQPPAAASSATQPGSDGGGTSPVDTAGTGAGMAAGTTPTPTSTPPATPTTPTTPTTNATAAAGASGSPSSAPTPSTTSSTAAASVTPTRQAGADSAGSTASGSAATGQAAAAQAAKTASKGTIRLKAGAKDSWVEVREADGSALHNGLVKAGDTVELSGKPPYRLVIGNASHLEVVYEGRIQNLAPHMRTNNIARLELK